MTTQIQWLLRRNLPSILAMEADAYPPDERWGEGDYIETIGSKSHLGLIAERGDKTIGVMVYELRRSSLVLHRIIVAPLFRNQGVGRLLLDTLYAKANSRRPRIKSHVNEYNTRGHLFLRACGWRCYSILHSRTGTCYSFERRQSVVECEATGRSY